MDVRPFHSRVCRAQRFGGQSLCLGSKSSCDTTFGNWVRAYLDFLICKGDKIVLIDSVLRKVDVIILTSSIQCDILQILNILFTIIFKSHSS